MWHEKNSENVGSNEHEIESEPSGFRGTKMSRIEASCPWDFSYKTAAKLKTDEPALTRNGKRVIGEKPPERDSKNWREGKWEIQNIILKTFESHMIFFLESPVNNVWVWNSQN